MVLHKFIGFDHLVVAVPLERYYGPFVIWHFEFLLILVLLVQKERAPDKLMYVLVWFRQVWKINDSFFLQKSPEIFPTNLFLKMGNWA